MKRLWELIINARGVDRFYCFPFLLAFRFLTPFYQAVSRWHLRSRTKRCSREWKSRVISVGSITVGGSGKTPIVIELARRFIEKNMNVVIVHSGYGRSIKDDVIVDYGKGGLLDIKETGDEVAVMLSMLTDAGFAVGRNKKKMIIAVDRQLNPDVIIVDDGFQRLDIKKDTDIAVIDPEFLKGKSRLHLFPGGTLREPFAALERADSLFLVERKRVGGTNDCISLIRNYNPGADIIRWRLSFDRATIGGDQVEIDQLHKRKPFLFAGIGSFEGLIDMIRDSGIDIAGYYRFGDHYDYDKLDVDHLRGMATQAGADCYLTTAKDIVKLENLSFDRPVYCLYLKATPLDEAVIERLLKPEAQ